MEQGPVEEKLWAVRLQLECVRQMADRHIFRSIWKLFSRFPPQELNLLHHTMQEIYCLHTGNRGVVNLLKMKVEQWPS